jgi:hypothetical protein
MNHSFAKWRKEPMSKLSEFEITQKFREQVDRGDITEDIKVIYQISGGMPSERVEEEFRLSGNGNVNIKVRDVLKAILAQEASVELERAETRDLFQKIVPGLDSLVPRSEARFLPDSLVGSITIQVGGEEATLYFLADEDERISQDKPIAPQIAEAIQHFTNITQRSIEMRKEGNE